jgi:glyoxylase-like metal-dependent hydrolase (beta-lactamase superfamily II)
MTSPITRQRDIESLKVAAGWPDADRTTLVVLAARLAAAGMDADGYRFFQRQSGARPDQALPLAFAGYFQARLGEDGSAGLAKLDQAASADLGLPQYLRGLALAGLPPDPERAKQAITDLEFVLAVRDQFPLGMIRAAHCGLAAAYAALGKHDQATEAASKSGLGPAAWDTRLLVSSFWMTADDGFRFTTPKILRPEANVHVAQGYDFADFSFITTGGGLIAIDAGTSEQRVNMAIADLGLPAGFSVTHLIITHADWDHVGGTGALRGPGTRVITQDGFPAALARQQQGNAVPFRYFYGDAPAKAPDIIPDQLISEPASLTVGGTELMLYPTRGGESPDALMVYLPASRLLFTGDVMMPYIGNPFLAEGSPEGLLEILRFIRELGPRTLIQGHTALTENFTIGVIPGLEAALTELHGQVLADILAHRPLPDILDRCYLPEALRDHPAPSSPTSSFATTSSHACTTSTPATGNLMVRACRSSPPVSKRQHSACSPAAKKSPSSMPPPPWPARATTRSRWKSSRRGCCATPPARRWPSCAKPCSTGSWTRTSNSSRSGTSSTPNSPAPKSGPSGNDTNEATNEDR